MNRVLGVLTAEWFVTLVGALALSLIVWFVGPLIAVADMRPLESELVRGIVVLAIILAWGLYNTLTRVQATRTDRQMMTSLAEPSQNATAAEAAAEIAVLRQRLEEALGLIKKSAGTGGRRFLYQLPWYMLIGPPGSGKTTALQNSGLNFPLAQRYGKDPVKGVGGTRNCDWWLTDDAVLLDTAGRYTTQDSNQASDQAAWHGFLGLLKRFRPRQPINGALVAISIGDVANLSQADLLTHARSIRQRLAELHDELGLRFPIYVLFTKADLIAGFVEFFDDLGREDREQVWGVTLPLDDGREASQPAVVGVSAEFSALVARLNEHLLDRLQQETDGNKRALIWAFPGQVASLKEPILQFLNEVFLPNRFEARALLRGVYFTSGTQDGTPIDRLMSAMAATFGLERQRLPAFSGAGRSYFLSRLLRRVIFDEASVVSANPVVERRQRWIRRGVYAAAIVGLLACAAAWTASFSANRRLIAEVEAQLAEYSKELAQFGNPLVADDDIEHVLPALHRLRAIPAGYEAQDRSVPVIETFGLYQGDKLGPAAVIAYKRALNKVFLPRLVWHLGLQLKKRRGEPEYVHEALKTYLMLGGAGPFDKDFVRRALTFDWEASLAGPERAPLRREFAGHVEALLKQPLDPIPLDPEVIKVAREALMRASLAGRAYAVIKQSDEARATADWRIAEHAGPAADRVLVTQNGALSGSVPGLYTYEGFHKVFLPQLGKASATMARESWVLGEAAPATNGEKLEGEVLGLYLADYVTQWDRVLGDVGVAPFRGVQGAVTALNLLSAPNESPLKLLYLAVARETKLTLPSEPPAAPGGAPPDPLKKLMVPVPGAAAKPAAGQAVDDHFKWLHDYVGLGEKGPAPIDQTMRALNDVYLQINKMAQPSAPDAVPTRPGSGALDALKSQSAPPRIAQILRTIQQNASNLTLGGTREQIRERWSLVQRFCRQALEERYPFVHGSQTDMTLDDFTKLFAPSGKIDEFFATNLRQFVDASRAPWRWQKFDSGEDLFSAEALMQFQRAAAIRDGFFAAGGASPSLRFELVPVSLDAKSTQVLIEVDGQEVTYSNGPLRASPLQWPGPAGARQGRVVFSPQVPGQPYSIPTKTGPWSLFRLFDEAKFEGIGLADRVRITFSVGERKAVFEIRANSVINPLTMKELGEFRCPSL